MYECVLSNKYFWLWIVGLKVYTKNIIHTVSYEADIIHVAEAVKFKIQ